ncbi:MAG: tRNA (adenosine(37)-N6)-threonylcarbamoyltransferase complex ATPase subunit type 1 TsaE [Clostridiales bacterium]|jgi:tRNA threonylcarbamoyladenosine biosynthesis protein TsaE|nr:tRNA (adenosine(37)-N6)-threonylcarbamoyltransferase complex ATPase subunit type 1 TsaE [Clostridiales bacterium]
MGFIWNSNSPQETEALGKTIAATLKGGEVIALYGGMGMGKTAFTRGVAEGLGILGGVSSPTFALVHEYAGGRLPLYHFDMYRVTSWDDLYSTGFFDYLDTDAVLVIEWSENIDGALPEKKILISVERGEGEEQRIFHVEGVDI